MVQTEILLTNMTKEIFPQKPHLLACVLANSRYENFITYVAQKAKVMKGEFVVLCVDNFEDDLKSAYLRKIKKYTKSLGGKFICRDSTEQVEIIAKYIIEEINYPCEAIYVQHNSPSKMLSLVDVTLADQLKKIIGDKITIFEEPHRKSKKKSSLLLFLIKHDNPSVQKIILSILITVSVFISLLYFYSSNFCVYCNVSLADITPILMIISFILTIYFDLISGAISLLVSITIIVYFFAEPLEEGSIFNIQERTHLSVFIISNIIGNILCALLKAENIIIHNNEKILRTLFKIYRYATNELEADKIIRNFHEEVTSILDTNIMFYHINSKNKAIEVVFSGQKLTIEERQIIIKCFEQSTHFKETIVNDSGNYVRNYMPLSISGKKYGVLVIDVLPMLDINSSYTSLIFSVRDLLADLLERANLINSIENHKIYLEQEKLRSTLLLSVSHDFKTPLASIVGALEQYQRMQVKQTLTTNIANNLVEMAAEEAERLSKFITNTLNATRLENNLVKFIYDWSDPYELIQNVSRVIQAKINSIKFSQIISSRSYEIYLDRAMVENIIQNILENSIKYNEYKPNLSIYAHITNNYYRLSFQDDGPGVPADQLEKIFDKYERIKQTDAKIAGTGLGLSIVEQVMQEHQGNVYAENSVQGGLIIHLQFPNYRQKIKENN